MCNTLVPISTLRTRHFPQRKTPSMHPGSVARSFQPDSLALGPLCQTCQASHHHLAALQTAHQLPPRLAFFFRLLAGVAGDGDGLDLAFLLGIISAAEAFVLAITRMCP